VARQEGDVEAREPVHHGPKHGLPGLAVDVHVEARIVRGEAANQPDELLRASVGRDDVGDSHVVGAP
jgi:hypothetical protein